ncbi:MAG: hypothetical protein KBS81_03490 [Spirochaetales bacterium]|nr:hypothetical protein [Candidatus Physcosoma equi]
MTLKKLALFSTLETTAVPSWSELYGVFFLVVVRMMQTLVILCSTVDGYYQNGFNVPAVLRLLVYSSFVLQTYRLSEKRRLEKEEL